MDFLNLTRPVRWPQTWLFCVFLLCFFFVWAAITFGTEDGNKLRRWRHQPKLLPLSTRIREKKSQPAWPIWSQPTLAIFLFLVSFAFCLFCLHMVAERILISTKNKEQTRKTNRFKATKTIHIFSHEPYSVWNELLVTATTITTLYPLFNMIFFLVHPGVQ